MDEKPTEILKRIEEWAQMVRRYMKHDIECSIWRETYRVCDCGLDDALNRIPKRTANG